VAAKKGTKSARLTKIICDNQRDLREKLKIRSQNSPADFADDRRKT
jgi:hypothetical protein